MKTEKLFLRWLNQNLPGKNLATTQELIDVGLFDSLAYRKVGTDAFGADRWWAVPAAGFLRGLAWNHDDMFRYEKVCDLDAFYWNLPKRK